MYFGGAVLNYDGAVPSNFILTELPLKTLGGINPPLPLALKIPKYPHPSQIRACM